MGDSAKVAIWLHADGMRTFVTIGEGGIALI